MYLIWDSCFATSLRVMYWLAVLARVHSSRVPCTFTPDVLLPLMVTIGEFHNLTFCKNFDFVFLISAEQAIRFMTFILRQMPGMLFCVSVSSKTSIAVALDVLRTRVTLITVSQMLGKRQQSSICRASDFLAIHLHAATCHAQGTFKNVT